MFSPQITYIYRFFKIFLQAKVPNMPARIPQADQQQTGNGAVNKNCTHYGNDEVVISGISGRLPESNSIAEFRENLFAGVDMVTDDDRRWPAGK